MFPPEPDMCDWARHARRAAQRAVADPSHAAQFQCKGTWFVGLDALDNDPQGRVAGAGPLRGAAVEAIRAVHGWPALHRAQISITYPDYPKPRATETDAAFAYRRDRDAAHVDGVLGLGSPKRRFVREPHSFILGVPLTDAAPQAAPLVVWDGSHRIMRDAFARAFAGRDPATLGDLDVTETYQAARRTAFETCARVVVHGAPGSAYVVHRLALHGVAPWGQGATAAPEGRMIAYFRPPMPGGAAAWVAAG
ncbi:hypothetical protein [Sulfitobacter sabulilitoris]|nr:hypothetical protein [Sulfitobacter sabulilitoris]